MQDLALQAYQSRTLFHRLLRKAVEETPGAMRRRLLLERAAYQLAHTGISVTEVALDANYGSLEAFTRAFRKACLTRPSLDRRMRDPHFHLPASNKIHSLAPGFTKEVWTAALSGADMDMNGPPKSQRSPQMMLQGSKRPMLNCIVFWGASETAPHGMTPSSTRSASQPKP